MFFLFPPFPSIINRQPVALSIVEYGIGKHGLEVQKPGRQILNGLSCMVNCHGPLPLVQVRRAPWRHGTCQNISECRSRSPNPNACLAIGPNFQ